VTDQDPVEILKTLPRDAAGTVTGSQNRADPLTEVETRCSYALQGSGLGVWDWNLESNKVYWSPVWLGMLGYQEGEISPSFAVWRRLLHPQDYDRVVAYGANFLNNPSGRYEIEFRLRHKEGHWVDILSRATLARDCHGHPVVPRRLVGTHMDQSARKALELSMRESSLRYQAMCETTRDGFCVVAMDGRILEVNDAYCRMTGYSQAEMVTLSLMDLEAQETHQDTLRHIQIILEQGNDQFESRQRRKDGEIFYVEASASFSPVEGGRLFSFVRDITDRKRGERLATLRQRLLELIPLGDLDQLLRAALDVAEDLTHSQIGFLHFFTENQEEISLQVWSSRTLAAEMCRAAVKDRHYPVREAGVWVDCIRQRQPVIHNDYASLPHKKGMPEGHAPLVREATVPLLVDGRVVAVIGVGNKASDYTALDLDILRQVVELAMDFAERQKVGKQMEYIAYYDVLTGLPNRALLTDRLRQAVAQADRAQHFVAVCYLNLDGFKPINDRHGHHLGDGLLVALARRLQDSLRQGDSVARVGGDEFGILLTGLTSSFDGLETAQRLLNQVNVPIEAQGHRLHLSGSMGVTLFPTDSGGPDALLQHAHQAMFQAKGQRQGSYHLFDPVQDHQERQRRRLSEEFSLALRSEQLRLYFQPKVALADGDVFGLEALIRWQHPRDGLLAPDQFLPIIADTPLEIALGEWVIGAALAQQQAWRAIGLALAVSVNISPRQIQMQGFVDLVARTLASYPAGTAKQLEIEVLEVSKIDNTGDAARVMTACKALGVRFSLDDFGTGYSSLTYFHQLPFDLVKIDRNFVRDMLVKPDDLAIVEGVLRMAKAMSSPVLAEGVESLEIGLMLYQLGCQFGQGFGIAPPLPAEQVPPWVEVWQTNRPWHNLAAAVHAETRSVDLNVAIYSLRYWLDQFRAYLRGDEGVELPIQDEYQCQFCRWYQGIGEARFGRNAQYAPIQTLHHRLHALAAGLVGKAKAGKGKRRRTRLAEFDALGEELIGRVRALGD
jgi:diguanylate cyclase (GGDEF)-like protein/PAS domain S-box-containing protein